MKTQPTGLVSKRKALEMVAAHINKPGVIDLPQLIELLTWQTKLTLWLLKEHNKQHPSKGNIL